MKRLVLLVALVGTLLLGWQSGSNVAGAERRTVRDAMWVWAHYEGSYDNQWGLPGKSTMTPVGGAAWLNVPNIIMLRYGENPKPPFDQYAASFRPVKRVLWSVTGAAGATSENERNHVFALAAKMPNIVGVFMDDFFHFHQSDIPQWLAQNNAHFPVLLTLTLPKPTVVDRLALTQSAWKGGGYRSARFAVDLAAGQEDFQEVAQGTLPNTPGATVAVALPKREARAVRIRVLGTHDTNVAKSCGLCRLQLSQADKPVVLTDAAIKASSEYPGHPAEILLGGSVPPPAALSVDDLRQLCERLNVNGRKLDVGVTLYTYQLDKRIIPHLQHCDIISLWTWKPADLAGLEGNLTKLEQLMPGKRILLGLYMWDFDAGKPIPLDLMKMQCRLGLKWLHEGRIEGMIFLAAGLCDLNLEAVNWSRSWIAEVGDQALDAPRRK